MNTSKTLSFILSLWMLAIMLVVPVAGCTVVRRVVGPSEPKPEPKPVEPKVVDLLVMTELNRDAVSLSESYQAAVLELTAALAIKQVDVRKIALAPMYRRTHGTVPLIYGEGDEHAEFSSIADAVYFFAQDNGQEYLRERAVSDGENLAALGLEIDTRPIYHPTTADTDGTPYFTEPADGFIIMQLTAKERSCAFSDERCKLDNMTAAKYFTEQDGDGEGVRWLELPGGKSLSKNKIFFLPVATSEGISEDAFYSSCEGHADFPAGKLDYMEPSPNAYYVPFIQSVKHLGGQGDFMDLCVAMSPISATAKMLDVASQVRSML